MTLFAGLSIFVGLAVAGVLLSDRRQWRAGVWIAKPLASAGFVAAAVVAGAPESPYGIAVLVALSLSALGDVFLIPHSKKCFLAGLVSFLAAHVAFGVALWLHGTAWLPAGLVLVVLIAPAVLVERWLLSRVPKKLRLPVHAYMVAITLMVAMAAGAGVASRHWLIPAAALVFYVSDLSVARDRFVTPGFANRLWGMPLYYGAQLLFALTTASCSHC